VCPSKHRAKIIVRGEGELPPPPYNNLDSVLNANFCHSASIVFYVPTCHTYIQLAHSEIISLFINILYHVIWLREKFLYLCSASSTISISPSWGPWQNFDVLWRSNFMLTTLDSWANCDCSLAVFFVLLTEPRLSLLQTQVCLVPPCFPSLCHALPHLLALFF
jgi:hypothetical protein